MINKEEEAMNEVERVLRIKNIERFGYLFGGGGVILVMVLFIYVMALNIAACSKPSNQSSTQKYAPIEVSTDKLTKPREGKIVQGPYYLSGGIAAVGVLTTLANGNTVVTTALISPHGAGFDGSIIYPNSKMMQQLTIKLKMYTVRTEKPGMVLTVWVVDQ